MANNTWQQSRERYVEGSGRRYGQPDRQEYDDRGWQGGGERNDRAWSAEGRSYGSHEGGAYGTSGSGRYSETGGRLRDRRFGEPGSGEYGRDYDDYARRGYDEEIYGGREPRYASGFGEGTEDRRYGSQGYGRSLDEGRGEYGRGRSGEERFRGTSYGSESAREYEGSGGFGRTRFDQGSGSRESDRYTRGFSEPGRQGGFRGKGPKGYTRSDERIKEDISERFSDDDRLDASNIEVDVSSGEVTLSGDVSDRSAKRRAEDLAEQCSGVKQVQNNIRLQSGDGQSESSSRLSSALSTGESERGDPGTTTSRATAG